MKKALSVILVFLLIGCVGVLTACGAIDGIFDSSNSGNDESGETFDEELESSTGKWFLVGDDDTYFTFNGAKDVMSFTYVEDGVSKYSGNYRVIHRGVGSDVNTPLTIILKRNDKSKEDWLGCYTENFSTSFTQFTILDEEEDLGMTDASLYTHIYRISELPYKMGTYILEGNSYVADGTNYSDGNYPYIPTGTYTLESGESFTFLMSKPRGRELFLYRNGDTVVEGTFTIAQPDKNTIYLYISHDPYSKVTNADKNHYDTTFDIYYPPDLYLRGDFSQSGKIVINGLYHHTSSPITVPDSLWTYGTYMLEE